MEQDTRFVGRQSRIEDQPIVREPIVKDATDARQGTDRAPVIYVLAGGMALATVAFMLMFTVH